MKGFSVIILCIFTALTGFERTERDSIFFKYSDFDAYKTMNSGLNFSNTDSLSSFRLTGGNSRTIYDRYSKNDFGMEGYFSIFSNNFKYGCVLSTTHISNTLSTRPTNNDIKIMPLAGYAAQNFNLEAAAGYIAKTDEISYKEGGAFSLNGTYSVTEFHDRFKIGSQLSADNTDEELNYNSSADFSYLKILGSDYGNFGVRGSGNIHQYNFSDPDLNMFRIKRYQYDIDSEFSYTASEKLKNTARARFYTRNRDSYKNSSSLSYNSNTEIGISDEIIYFDDKLISSIRVDIDTGSDKFSLDYRDADKSLAFYNFSLSTQSKYSFRDFLFGLSGRYFKHEYKSLTLSNLEDRDIVRLSVSPEVSYSANPLLKFSQSFPLEYHKLINISSMRSTNNYTDRIVNSVTGLRSDISSDLYLTASAHIRTYYRTYDFDEFNSKSFVIKNYSLSDTVSYRVMEKLSLKLSNRYIYEEFGYFNYGKFTSNPVNYKNHYYSSISLNTEKVGNFILRGEYFFYEIDSYDFDQDDFSKSELTRVYISHGPRLSLDYGLKNFRFMSSLEIENFRLGKNRLKFSIESFVSFN